MEPFNPDQIYHVIKGGKIVFHWARLGGNSFNGIGHYLTDGGRLLVAQIDGNYLGTSEDEIIPLNLEGGFFDVDGSGGTDLVDLSDRVTDTAATVNLTTGEITRDDESAFIKNVEKMNGTNADTDLLDGSAESDDLTANLSTGTLNGNTIGLIEATDFEQISGGSGNDSFTGSSGANTLTGNAGNDTLFGKSGDDVLRGGNGNDSLVGGDGNDSISGGNGNDFFKEQANDGRDTLDGGAGIDTLSFDDNTSSHSVSVNLHQQTATRNGQLNRFDNIEIIVGSDASNDTVTATGNSNGVSINLSTGVISGISSGIQSISKFENVTGGSGADTLIGSSGRNTLSGGDGLDSINGQSGNDSLLGGTGNDTLIGSDGNDTLSGDSGDDDLQGGNNDDTYEFANGFGTDVITETGGNDTLDYSQLTGFSTINFAGGTLTTSDSTATFSSIENFEGGSSRTTYALDDAFGNFTITDTSTGGDDTIDASDISTDLTVNVVTGILNTTGGTLNFSGIESIISGSGDDTFLLDDDFDSLQITDNAGGIDTLDFTAISGNLSVIMTTNGASSVEGGTLSSGGQTVEFSGFEIIIGGAGNDVLSINNASGTISYTDAAGGTDTLNCNSITTDFVANFIANTITSTDIAVSFAGFESIRGGSGDDTYIFDDAYGNVTISDAAGGTDTLDLSAVATDLTISLSGGTAETTGGNLTLSGIDNIVGGSGNDDITGNSVNNLITDAAGNEEYNGYLSLGFGQDTIDDAAGTDALNFYNGSNGFASSDVVDWEAVDLFNGGALGTDGNVDSLEIDFGSGNVVTVYHYFDNSAANAAGSAAGAGLLEAVVFSDGSLNFAAIQALA